MSKNTDKEQFSISLDPRLVRMIDALARERFTSRSQIFSDAIRKYILQNITDKQDTPEFWDKYYTESFEESKQ